MKSLLAIIREWHGKIRRQREERVFRRLFEALLKAKNVSFGRICYGGIVTAAARAYYKILASPTAHGDFLYILENGNGRGRSLDFNIKIC